jgi:phenylpropionate dioxygenase-like ring-hydroxylating dioxygenase large terminal subunit
MRGKDGQIRGFHNTCSHRGNKVVVETGEETFGRNKAVVTCRFHGWVQRQRQHREVPEENKFPPTSTRTRTASPRCTPTCGKASSSSISTRPRRKRQPLAEFLGGIGTHLPASLRRAVPVLQLPHLPGLQLEGRPRRLRRGLPRGHHPRRLLPQRVLVGPAERRAVRPHRTTAICLSLDAEPTPVAKIANSLATGSLVAQRGASMLPPTVNPDRRDDFSFELSVLFPNLLLHISEGIWFTHQFWPIAHNKTLWEGKYYVRPAKTNSQRWALEHAQCLQRNAWLEDTATMEDTQTALESGAKQVMHLQDDEILIRHGYHALEAYMHAE